MGKLLGALMSLIGAVCAATVIAAVVLWMYYSKAWNVNREHMVQALAILQGKSPESLIPPPPVKKDKEGEQPAYNQILEARAMKARDLELREQAVRTNLQQLQSELNKIADEKNRVKLVSEEFQSKLNALQKSSTSTGMAINLVTLQTLKPKEAKTQIAQMLEKGEMDDVVRILSDMSDNKRAKLISEFKTSGEAEQIGEILRRIRQGQPTAAASEEAARNIQPPKGPGT